MKTRSYCIKLALAGAGLFALAGPDAHAAISWNEIQVSGFFSQGYLQSSDNDYLAMDSSEGDSDFREYAVNASRRFGARWRVGAQVFGQELGYIGNDELTLDWAQVDFNARQEFGLRVGRIKMPRGLYNEALDLDIARPQLLLPQSMYDARLRDFNASIDGGMAYGNVRLGEHGSLDYRLFFGKKDLDLDSGVADFVNGNGSPLADRIELDDIRGGTLFWNAPASPLRVGYSFERITRVHAHEPMDFLFPGAALTLTLPAIDFHILSAEYILNDWTFSAEVGRMGGRVSIDSNFGLPSQRINYRNNFGYVAVSRRLSARWEAGTYVSITKTADAVTEDSMDHQTDCAFSVRFDPVEHLVLKAEIHFVDGTNLIPDRLDHPQPVAQRDDSWSYFAAKATVYF
jgi:hypothetical protein